ncbi:MAG: aminoacyl-tRNA hydrolase [Planctomycetes bacterium]|nr:aminoacyl-tRNA hydrolase [Planctomycetota bacterium]
MKIIVGLGNPDSEYIKTRHNVGFMAVDLLKKKLKGGFVSKKRLYYQCEIEDLILMKPLTFMNHSGKAATSIVTKYGDKLDLEEDLLVISDDVNLPLGRIRIRKSGSAGGHHGLESIIEHLGHDKFARFRIGVGGQQLDRLEEYVLQNFTRSEEKILGEVLPVVVEALLFWKDNGIEKMMNKYNSWSVDLGS